ncbi:MAG: type IV secretion system DNA-binding domain-containing protein [Verrucomicrobiales bacterium]
MSQDYLPTTPTEGLPYLWGGRFISFSSACKHFLAVGSTGSGKTVLISLLMKEVMREIAKSGAANARALVYDSKTDLLPIIKGMGVPEEKIVVLDPFDARVWAWDMAADITDPMQADDVASVLIPTRQNENNPYFPDTARRFLAGIIEVFIESAPGKWTLRDLVLAVKTPDRLKTILRSSEDTIDLEQHFEPPTTFANVNATLSGSLRKYRSIAAVWHRAGSRQFSIRDWIKSHQVMVMGNNAKAKEPIQRLNSLIFSEVAKEILSNPGRSTAENWIFLDEFGDLGDLNSLVDLMKLGRSKGAAVVLGTQDVADIDSVYGKDRSRTIFGNAQNLGIVHINSSQPETQRWASEVIGDQEYIREEKSKNSSVNQKGETTTGDSSAFKHVTEKAWLPSMFSSDLPPTDAHFGLTGVFRIGSTFFNQNIPGDILFGNRGKWNRVPDLDPTYPVQIPHQNQAIFKLPDWNQEDIDRLGIDELGLLLDPPTIPKEKSNPKGDLLDGVS